METIELKLKTIADVVKENIKTAHVFKKFGIDFCCGGGKSIEDACKKNNIDIGTLEAELNYAMSTISPSVNYNTWSLDFFCDYIEQTHHNYVRDSIPTIQAYVTKVSKVHGDASPELIEIKILFDKVVAELIPHMQKEELILFPYIRKMLRAQKENLANVNASFGTVQNPIHMMMHEHDIAGSLLKSINNLSNQYQAPSWACTTYKALYAKLEEFENDLHIHIHLENNILFPKAIEFEYSIN
jgi:regulator of cell morphogenesis and NO signaling